jgi:uncharacterized protein YukE
MEQVNKQKTAMTDVVDDISCLSATIEQIAVDANEVTDRSSQAADRVSESSHSTTRAIERMAEVRDVVQDMGVALDDLLGRLDGITKQTTMLEAVNRKTAARRDAPLLIIGNIAGEIAVLGEASAREARYENDSEMFDPVDTVCNVIDERTVDETFAAVYSGAGDQVLQRTGTDRAQHIELLSSPTGAAQSPLLDGFGALDPMYGD